ncbi:MAG: TlpA family protein disulfide reductase [Planctomycetes bacterium]|nr:TlpA family protein disulfide reductase [Planctomycetota bacterium]
MGRNSMAMLAVLLIGAVILYVGYRQGLFGSGDSYYKESQPGQGLYSLKITGATLTGYMFNSDEKRGKVLVVNIFGTWCGPCVEETPHLVNLFNELNQRGLEMVMVTEESAQKARPFASFNQIPYAIVPDGEDIVAQVPRFQGYPTTIILDKSGKVRYQIVGPQVNRIREAVLKLLDE